MSPVVDPEIASERARTAGLARQNASADRIAEQRRRYREARDSKLIRDLLDGKILSEEGLTRLAAMLAPEEDGGG